MKRYIIAMLMSILLLTIFTSCFTLRGRAIKFDSEKWLKASPYSVMDSTRYRMGEDVITVIKGKSAAEVMELLGKPASKYFDKSHGLQRLSYYLILDYYTNNEIMLVIYFENDIVTEAKIR